MSNLNYSYTQKTLREQQKTENRNKKTERKVEELYLFLSKKYDIQVDDPELLMREITIQTEQDEYLRRWQEGQN